MSLAMILGITTLKESWKIKVRIVRLWYQPDYNNLNITGSIEMVLVDEKTHIGRFDSLVKEDCYRLISHFGVVNNIGKHRATNHSYKINFF
ncbi:Eukaryotic translation initiation factor 3 subunit I [Bienertia sinuspersici]